MGATNFDAIAVPAGGTITVGGSPVGGLAAIGKGTTPSTGWTVSGNHAYKDVTVTGAAAGDVVLCTLNAVPFLGVAPMSLRLFTGYVTGANTVRLFFSEDAGGGLWGAATTIAGTISYIVFRPS
jgi:hypothetical protein